MSLYRCAACGSPNVIEQTENEGYSYKKGIFGAIMFGAAGAVAGVNGNTKQVYKCPDCGLTLNAPMPPHIKAAIDLGVSVPSTRDKNLVIGGMHISWDVITEKYKNIEKDTFVSQVNPDQEIKNFILDKLDIVGNEGMTSTMLARHRAWNHFDRDSYNHALQSLEQDSIIEKYDDENGVTFYRLTDTSTT